MMAALFHDPAFWYFVSFVIFLGVLYPKGSKLVQQHLTVYQNEISSQFQDLKHKIKTAKGNNTQALNALGSWPEQQKAMERAHAQELNDLEAHYQQKLEKLKIRRQATLEKYLESKRQEAQLRLERRFAASLVQDLQRRHV